MNNEKGLLRLFCPIFLFIFLLSPSIAESSSEKTSGNSKPSKESREDYVTSHPELNSRTRGLIRNGLVDVGMSKDEVRVSWGELDKVTIPSKKEDFDEIWVYAPSWKFKTYLYFKNDIVIRTGD